MNKMCLLEVKGVKEALAKFGWSYKTKRVIAMKLRNQPIVADITPYMPILRMMRRTDVCTSEILGTLMNCPYYY